MNLEQHIRDLITHVGDNPNREGVQDTPKRVIKALQELCWGYNVDPADYLQTTFPTEQVDQMIHVTGIEFISLCEHHMLPFTGTAHVAYIPQERVVGLSKIPRLVTAYAARLQIQENLTQQIADTLQQQLNPKGVGVTLTAHHNCMGIRGARQPNAQMTTTALTGAFLHQPEVRSEYQTFA